MTTLRYSTRVVLRYAKYNVEDFRQRLLQRRMTEYRIIIFLFTKHNSLINFNRETPSVLR